MLRLLHIVTALCFAVLLQSRTAYGQGIKSLFKYETDSSYINDHSDKLTVRLFGSRKYASYTLQDRGFAQSIKYKPNSPFNMGVGFNYKAIGINLGFNFPFINSTETFGRTRFLDLQTHLYQRKFVTDFYLQYYKGYYISDATMINLPVNQMPYIRPDITTVTGIFSFHYIFNPTIFSFRSAYLQNEYQKKSAGSFLLGAGIYTFFLNADSTIVPPSLNLPNFYDNETITTTRNVCLITNVGYAYTAVYNKHFFITGALSGGPGLGYVYFNDESGDFNNGKVDIQFAYTGRIAAGYNSDNFFAGIHYVTTYTRNNAPIRQAWQNNANGNFRISLATRIALKKKVLGLY